MNCPKCNAEALNEEKDVVICLKCGFRAPLQEYRLWKKIHEAPPRRREKVIFQENGRSYTESYTNDFDIARNRRLQLLVIILALTILLLLFM